MLTGVAVVGVIVTVSVDVAHDVTVSTNVVVTALDKPALLICPVTVIVYTPATVGANHAMILVDASNVINAVL